MIPPTQTNYHHPPPTLQTCDTPSSPPEQEAVVSARSDYEPDPLLQPAQARHRRHHPQQEYAPNAYDNGILQPGGSRNYLSLEPQRETDDESSSPPTAGHHHFHCLRRWSGPRMALGRAGGLQAAHQKANRSLGATKVALPRLPAAGSPLASPYLPFSAFQPGFFASPSPLAHAHGSTARSLVEAVGRE